MYVICQMPLLVQNTVNTNVMQEIDSESVRVFVCDLSNAFASSKYCEHKRDARNRRRQCVSVCM